MKQYHRVTVYDKISSILTCNKMEEMLTCLYNINKDPII